MVEVEANKGKKLLILRYTGHVGEEEVKLCLVEVASLLAGLQPGFRLLTDMTGLTSMDLECVAEIKIVMDLLNVRGVKTVVRVIPDPHKDIGMNILSLFHYKRGVQIITCQTLQEAEKLLA